MVMKFEALLDTDICIYIARHRPAGVGKRFAHAAPGSLAISIITWGELCFGANKSRDSKGAIETLQRFVSRIPVLPLDPEVGLHYGDIRASLERSGTPIGNNDLWIAAHARALGVKVVTNNTREFERVPGLAVERWQ
jgi:tRNA(fMet)-specific endonuclease VapC